MFLLTGRVSTGPDRHHASAVSLASCGWHFVVVLSECRQEQRRVNLGATAKKTATKNEAQKRQRDDIFWFSYPKWPVLIEDQVVQKEESDEVSQHLQQKRPVSRSEPVHEPLPDPGIAPATAFPQPLYRKFFPQNKPLKPLKPDMTKVPPLGD